MKSKQSRSRNVRIICKREEIRRTIHCSVLSTGCEKKSIFKDQQKEYMLKPVGFVARFRLFSSWIHTTECSFCRFPHKNRQFMCFFGKTVFLFDFKRRNVKFISCGPNQGKKYNVHCTPATVHHNFKSWCLFWDNKNPDDFLFIRLSPNILCTWQNREEKAAM